MTKVLSWTNRSELLRAYQDAKKAGKGDHILGKQATLFASSCWARMKVNRSLMSLTSYSAAASSILRLLPMDLQSAKKEYMN
jgi:hypothetical protein